MVTTDITLTPASDALVVHAQAVSEDGANFIDAWRMPYQVIDSGHIVIKRVAVELFSFSGPSKKV